MTRIVLQSSRFPKSPSISEQSRRSAGSRFWVSTYSERMTTCIRYSDTVEQLLFHGPQCYFYLPGWRAYKLHYVIFQMVHPFFLAMMDTILIARIEFRFGEKLMKWRLCKRPTASRMHGLIKCTHIVNNIFICRVLHFAHRTDLCYFVASFVNNGEYWLDRPKYATFQTFLLST